MNITSSVFRMLTDAELHAIIERSLHTRAASSVPLAGGLFNTTYRIETEDCGSVVLRVGPVNRHLLMKFEHDLMTSEAEVYRRCAECGIPVSEVLVCDTSKTILDRDFMIVRTIPGMPMSKYDAAGDPDNYARICRDIGRATQKFHSLEDVRFGRVAEVLRGGGFERWSDCMITEFDRWEAVESPTGTFSEAERRAARHVLNDAVPILDEITQPRLAHCDLWFGNILITDGNPPDFAAIIDADRAMWGDPDIDFSSIPWTKESPTFWDGYGTPLSMDDHSRIRRLIYTMMWSRFDTNVWQNQYNAPDSAAYTKNKALTQIRSLYKDFGIGENI